MTRSRFEHALLIVAAASGLAFAQDPAGQNGGWRRAGDPPPDAGQVQAPTPAPPTQEANLPPAQSRTTDAFGQPIGTAPAVQAGPSAPAPYGVPAELTLRPGTHITVRIDQELSSNRNQPGDPFTATLAQPIVIDGVVVAQRGQTVHGRVSDVEKQRASSPSRLSLELTELSFVDGSRGQVRSGQLMRQGGRMPGDQQFGTVANTTLLGAVVGNAVDWRSGGAIGAAVGAGVGLAAVMATRNRPTVVYPEAQLSFEVQAPVTVSTLRAPQAFRFADSSDFQQSEPQRLERRDRNRGCATCGPVGYPGYWGTGVSVMVGSGRYGRRGGWW